MTEQSQKRHLPVVAGNEFVRDEWYAILESRQLRRRPITVTRLGRKMVLWRDQSGTAVAQDAQCPHRGADLGLGRVVNGNLECPWHGFQFRPDGTCALVPCEGRSYQSARGMRTQRYQVAERYGIIWLWWGDAEDDAGPVPWFDELPVDLDRAATMSMEWKVPFMRAAEATMDLNHASFTHRKAFPGIGERCDPCEFEVAGDVIHARAVVRRDDGRPYNGQRGMHVRFSVRFPGLMVGEVLPRMQLVAALAPIDSDRTHVIQRYYTQVPFASRLVGQLKLIHDRLMVTPDDLRMMESCTPLHFDRHDYHYVPSDAGILKWHAMYRARINQQRVAADQSAEKLAEKPAEKPAKQSLAADNTGSATFRKPRAMGS